MGEWHVCSHPDCPTLVSRSQPCPRHGRPVNARWSPNRDTKAHYRDSAAAKRAQPWCTRCGATAKLDYHHLPDGSGIVVCNPCHTLEDSHARAR